MLHCTPDELYGRMSDEDILEALAHGYLKNQEREEQQPHPKEK